MSTAGAVHREQHATVAEARRNAIGRTGLVLLVVVVSSGCGEKQDGMAPVSGTVTLNGQTVTHGYVFAKPTEGRTAVGRIQPDGSFKLGTNTDTDGARVGEHTVTLAPPRADEDAPDGAVTPPPRYNSSRTSGLRMVVPPGGLVNHVIELEATEAEIRAAKNQSAFIE